MKIKELLTVPGMLCDANADLFLTDEDGGLEETIDLGRDRFLAREEDESWDDEVTTIYERRPQLRRQP